MSGSASSGIKAIGVIILGVLTLAAVTIGLALFVTVGAVYGSGVGLANYWRAFIGNVRPQRPAP